MLRIFIVFSYSNIRAIDSIKFMQTAAQSPTPRE